jgi:hypothetical protein
MTSFSELPQVADIVHFNTLSPGIKLTFEVALPGVVITTPAVDDVHKPVPFLGVLPNKPVVEHTVRSMPASAVVGKVLNKITLSLTLPHEAEVTVHLNSLLPGHKPVTPLVGEAGTVAELPAQSAVTTLHKPVPLVSVLPAKVVVLEHIFS